MCWCAGLCRLAVENRRSLVGVSSESRRSFVGESRSSNQKSQLLRSSTIQMCPLGTTYINGYKFLLDLGGVSLVAEGAGGPIILGSGLKVSPCLRIISRYVISTTHKTRSALRKPKEALQKPAYEHLPYFHTVRVDTVAKLKCRLLTTSILCSLNLSYSLMSYVRDQDYNV
jgi:hypothetical protein